MAQRVGAELQGLMPPFIVSLGQFYFILFFFSLFFFFLICSEFCHTLK